MNAESDTLTSLLDNAGTPPSDGACGPDLEYHPSFLAFMDAARSRPAQQLGDSVIGAREPEWRAVLRQGLALASESRDLRIAAVLVQAATELHGLPGLADGLALMRVWLADHWDGLHPTLLNDGEFDPLMRMNALAALADPEGTMGAIRRAILLDGRAGRLTLGDAEGILKGRSPADTAPVSTPPQLEQMLFEEYARNADRLAALARAHDALTAIDALWRERLPADYWPELGALQDMLARLDALAARVQALPEPARPETEQTSSASLPGCVQTTVTARLPDQLFNRQDAYQALAIARQYFERHEPSHPAPLLIRRIERLSGLGFAEILAELTPDALSQLRSIAGTADQPG